MREVLFDGLPKTSASPNTLRSRSKTGSVSFLYAGIYPASFYAYVRAGRLRRETARGNYIKGRP